MALITKQYLIEQIRSLLAGGSPSAGAKFEPRMIASHLQQAINRRLKAEYLTITLPGDETIPEGIMTACYDAVPVEKYKGLSRAKLPAMPVSLRRNMGVWFVGPHVSNLNLETPELTATANGSSSVNLSWSIVPHETSFYLERAESVDFVDGLTDVFLGDAQSFIDTGLSPATTYYYRITAQAIGINRINIYFIQVQVNKQTADTVCAICCVYRFILNFKCPGI